MQTTYFIQKRQGPGASFSGATINQALDNFINAYGDFPCGPKNYGDEWYIRETEPTVNGQSEPYLIINLSTGKMYSAYAPFNQKAIEQAKGLYTPV